MWLTSLKRQQINNCVLHTQLPHEHSAWRSLCNITTLKWFIWIGTLCALFWDWSGLTYSISCHFTNSWSFSPVSVGCSLYSLRLGRVVADTFPWRHTSNPHWVSQNWPRRKVRTLKTIKTPSFFWSTVKLSQIIIPPLRYKLALQTAVSYVEACSYKEAPLMVIVKAGSEPEEFR